MVPSLDDAMPAQFCVLPVVATSVQVEPELAEVQMFPLSATAASLVPSLEDVMPLHSFVLPVVANSVQLDASAETRVEIESRATSRNLSTLRRSIVRISVVRLT